MAELAQLQLYEGSRASMEVYNVKRQLGGGGNEDFVLVEFEDGYIYRVRFATIKGQSNGGPGNVTLALWISVNALANQPWTNSSNATNITAGSPQVIAASSEWTSTWSTEIGDNYFSTDHQWGHVGMLGFPLVWIPGNTSLHLDVTDDSAGAITSNILDGFVQVERFVAGAGGEPQPALEPYSYLYSYTPASVG